MENASKALIIAGAILLSILIISLGIMIFGQASEVIDQNAMSDLEITQFNTKFTQYTGDKVRGAQVNSLINVIVQNNVTQDDTSKQVQLKVPANNWTAGTKTPTEVATKVTSVNEVGRAQTGKLYEVSWEPDPHTGLVSTITIDDVKSSGT